MEDATGYALRIFSRAINTPSRRSKKEVEEPAQELHLSTADHLKVGFHPWLNIRSARWLKFGSAPTVCHYMRALDAEWPFWLFFFNQVDESIKVVAMCLASTIEIAPGAADIDSEGLKHFLERGFSAVNYLFDTYGFPESENEVLSMGVTQILENSMIDPDRDGYSLG